MKFPTKHTDKQSVNQVQGHILETSLENLRKISYLRKIIKKYLAKH